MSASSRNHASTILKLVLFLGLVAVGCQSDDPTGPGDHVVLEPGDVNIDTGELDAPWFLLRPDKLVEQGTGSERLDGLPAGQYRMGWGAVPGWQSPTPNPELQALGSGAEITFAASYSEIVVETGSIAIDANPDEINAPWILIGPHNFYLEGNGDQVIDGREPGTYTVTWQPVPNYQEQPPSQAVLVAGGRIDLGSSYIYQAPAGTGTILVDVNPDQLNAPWTLTGPNGFTEQGNGDASIGPLDIGAYRVVFGPVAGWSSPQPGVLNETLSNDDLLTMTGNYTVINDPTPGDPSISQVSGSLSRDAIVTITGSSFGSQPVDVESSLGGNGWIESNSVGTRVNSLQGAPNWASFSASVPAYVDNTRAHSGNKAINASVDRGRDGDWNKVVYYTKQSGFDKIYATWWVYFDPIRYGDETQWKIWRVGDQGGNMVASDNCASLYQTSMWSPTRDPWAFHTIFHCKDGCQWPEQTQCYENILPQPYYSPLDGSPYNYQLHSRGGAESFKDNLPLKGQWCRSEIFLDASDIDTPNGKYWLAINRPGERRNIIDNWVDGLITRRSDCCKDESDEWQNFVLQGYFDDNGGPFQDEAVDLFYDDIYLQFGTAARVELGNHQEFESCTQLEVQESRSWQNGQIQIKLNYGGFAPGTQLYLFVVDHEGSVSAGYPVTLQ